jgi:lipopolysaccharide transport system ATP-binding protein
MARDTPITVDAVSKQYQLGELGRGHDRVSEAITKRIGRLRTRKAQDRSKLWALRDVSFDVEEGEALGIIGRNGAGKSTLLKILARITPPTAGEARIRGRVGALLEVGAGFHPDLTGRENISLNGAVLGMKKSEIAAKFDEIVAFAEVERFIDTPVKRYSTGMHLRLAFAVAAHLEPEILIVDEVLSVGDLAFQEKCLGRMDAVVAEGRTILFVSHNLVAVQHFCQRCLLLSGGRKIAEGPPGDVIDTYTQGVRAGSRASLADVVDRVGTGQLRFQEVRLEADGETIDGPATGQSFDFVLRYETADRRPMRNVNFWVWITADIGQVTLDLSSHETGTYFPEIPGEGEVRCTLPRCPLPAGRYEINCTADIAGEHLDWVEGARELVVREGDFFGSGQRQPSNRSVLVDHSWSVTRVGGETGKRAAVPL